MTDLSKMAKAAVKSHIEAQTPKIKTYKSEFYSINSILGNNDSMFYILLGGRQAGKSYSAMQWAVKRKLKLGDKFKFYWFRLTDSAAHNLLVNGADKFVDADIRRKYGDLKFTTKGDTIYTYDEEEIVHPRSGKVEIKKTNLKEFCTVLSCSTFYNTKGVAYFDNEYDGEYYLVLDEMNREQSEKNNFDIVYNFVNLCENIVRNTKNKIKIVLIGNTLDEASDILAAFNFLPDGFGRYKLKNKRCVIDYIMPNEQYKRMRAGSVADTLLPDASTFSNEVVIDRSLLVNRRLATRPETIIKFGKTSSLWFTVWNGNIIKPWNKEQVHNTVAMKRYLDDVFNPVAQKNVIEAFDARFYHFTDLACFKRFQKQMRLLKNK